MTKFLGILVAALVIPSLVSSAAWSQSILDAVQAETTVDGWVGFSHFSVRGDAAVGGTYGADAEVFLGGDLSAWGLVSANHFSNGSQLAASTGIVKNGNGENYYLGPVTGAVLIDQFTDSRLDTHLTSIRLEAGYRFYVIPDATPDNPLPFEIGATYSDYLDQDLLFNIANSNVLGITSTGILRIDRQISGYVATRIAGVGLDVEMGRFLRRDSNFAAVSSEIPICDGLYCFANVLNAFDEPDWGSSFGLTAKW